MINALMLKIAAAMMPGFRVNGCLPALIGAILLGAVNTLMRWALFRL